MITKIEKNIILKCARKYNASILILFGSSLEKDVKSNDIDIGVKGIQPHLFFKFYAELIKHLTKSVHLIDLSSKSPFNGIVEETGVKIYG